MEKSYSAARLIGSVPLFMTLLVDYSVNLGTEIILTLSVKLILPVSIINLSFTSVFRSKRWQLPTTKSGPFFGIRQQFYYDS